MTHKYGVGDIVVHDGLRAKVEYHTGYSNEPGYGLTSVVNAEFSTSTRESQIEEFDAEAFDFDAEVEKLREVEIGSDSIMRLVGGLTDKYFRDGNH